jgi:hypothetical protein
MRRFVILNPDIQKYQYRNSFGTTSRAVPFVLVIIVAILILPAQAADASDTAVAMDEKCADKQVISSSTDAVRPTLVADEVLMEGEGSLTLLGHEDSDEYPDSSAQVTYNVRGCTFGSRASASFNSSPGTVTIRWVGVNRNGQQALSRAFTRSCPLNAVVCQFAAAFDPTSNFRITGLRLTGTLTQLLYAQCLA